MTIKKYYQNGKLTSVGFDSLEEIFAFRNKPNILTEDTPTDFHLKDKERAKIHQDPEFKKFKEKFK